MTRNIVVTGGRSPRLHTAEALDNVLGELVALTGFEVLFEGGCKGTDAIAREWAIKKGVHVETVRARWKEFGVSAGPRRNQEMLEIAEPIAVVVFPGGKGTDDCERRARKMGLRVVVVTFLPGHICSVDWAGIPRVEAQVPA